MFQLFIEQCHCEEVEWLSDALEEAGAVSVTLTDRFDDPILEPAPGEIPLWTNVVVCGLFEDEKDAEHAQKALSKQYPHLQFSIHTLPDQDWERACMDNFKPQQFGQRLWICPSWLTPPDPHAVNLILDPGLAFGTGSHQTTSLCLTWLEQANVSQKTIIDYGCGSGILGLAALKLGAKHVYAVDIDEQALLATKSNAMGNAITDQQLTTGQPSILQEAVELLLANILLSPLLALQSSFHTLLKPTGQLVVSGILVDQIQVLIDSYHANFEHQATFLQDDWALVVFTPRAVPLQQITH